PGYATRTYQPAYSRAIASSAVHRTRRSKFSSLTFQSLKSLSPASTRAARLRATYPGLAVSPWATCHRPRVRGPLGCVLPIQGSRTRPGLNAIAREYAGCAVACYLPTARGLVLGYMTSPASTRAARLRATYPGLADSPWATCCRPRVRGLANHEAGEPRGPCR